MKKPDKKRTKREKRSAVVENDKIDIITEVLSLYLIEEWVLDDNNQYLIRKC